MKKPAIKPGTTVQRTDGLLMVNGMRTAVVTEIKDHCAFFKGIPKPLPLRWLEKIDTK